MFYAIDQFISGFGIFAYVIMYPIWALIIFFAYKYSKNLYKKRKVKGKKSWYVILLISILTFIVITGNWLPNEVYYKYACNQLSEDSLKVYMTPEEWIAENQDLLSGEPVELKINHREDFPQTLQGEYVLRTGYQSENKYFTTTYYYKDLFSRVYIEKTIFYDNKTGRILMSLDIIKKNGRFYADFTGAIKGTVGCFPKYKEYISIKDAFLQIRKNN